jgi:hypothetical protein
MTDVAAISGAIQSLKSAFEIGKAILDLSVSAQIQSRIMDINSKILAAQESAVASRDYQSTLLQRVDDLEKRIAEFEAWDAEADTYVLTDLRNPGDPRGSILAYAPKQGTHTSERAHHLCAKCYQDRHKSILQRETRHPYLAEVLVCHHCGSDIYLQGAKRPEHFKTTLPRKKPS